MWLVAESWLSLLSLDLGLRLWGVRMLLHLCMRLRVSVFLLAEDLELQE